MTRKELILEAIRRNKETVETCESKEPIPDDIGEKRKIWLAIKETQALAKGRLQAFEAVLSAMNGNLHMLNYYASR